MAYQSIGDAELSFSSSSSYASSSSFYNNNKDTGFVHEHKHMRPSKSIIAAGVGSFVLSVALLCYANATTVAVQGTSMSAVADSQSNLVASLPGFGPVRETQYAGFLEVNRTAKGAIFYWMIEGGAAIANAEEIPMLVWLNGGPGASSMTGALSENGPYHLNADKTLSYNEYAWTKAGHMLFFDQPVGAGYAFTENDDGYVNNLEEMAADMYTALTGFFLQYPQYAKNPIYFTGESYAGKYIPAICYHIYQKNQDPTNEHMNLAGMAIGNGELKPFLQYGTVADYTLAMGFIDQREYEWAQEQHKACGALVEKKEWVKAYDKCQAMEDQLFKWAQLPFIYDVRETSDSFGELTKYTTAYLNQQDVKEAFHVGDRPWRQSDGQGPSSIGKPVPTHLQDDEMQDISDEMIVTLLNNYKVLFYSGIYDASSCNHIGTSRMLDALPPFKGSDEYHKTSRHVWKVNGALGGYARAGGDMTFLTIINSGHLVPTNQPQFALSMMQQWLEQENGHTLMGTGALDTPTSNSL